MEIIFTPRAKQELEEWRLAGQVKLLQKVRELIESIQQSPFEGIGKPEALKHGLTGKWSRRVSKEHRLIYEISENLIMIFSLKGHYE